MKTLFRRTAPLALVGLLVALSGCITIIVPTASQHLVTSGIAYRPATSTGEVFLYKTLTVTYTSGEVILCHDSDGTGDFMVDDVMEVAVDHRDGGTAYETIDFTDECMHAVAPLTPRNITALFDQGLNTVRFTLRDGCAGNVGCTQVYLVVAP